MEETVYIGIYHSGKMVAAAHWPSVDDIQVEYIDHLHDLGFEIRPSTKEEYELTGWDELTPEDLKEGNYYYET